jgi:hypothetical protein
MHYLFSCIVQADKHHGTDCYDLAHKISKSLKHFENKLFNVIDVKYQYTMVITVKLTLVL